MCALLSANVNNCLSLFVACIRIQSVLSTKIDTNSYSQSVNREGQMENVQYSVLTLEKRRTFVSLYYRTYNSEGEICREIRSSIQKDPNLKQLTTNTQTGRFNKFISCSRDTVKIHRFIGQ